MRRTLRDPLWTASQYFELRESRSDLSPAETVALLRTTFPSPRAQYSQGSHNLSRTSIRHEASRHKLSPTPSPSRTPSAPRDGMMSGRSMSPPPGVGLPRSPVTLAETQTGRGMYPPAPLTLSTTSLARPSSTASLRVDAEDSAHSAPGTDGEAVNSIASALATSMRHIPLAHTPPSVPSPVAHPQFSIR
ncbi:hypothetical protein KIPB_012484 [Kipferlia bialata]|uniref:Uncharacterized protein n=1 Tax=Kipferlia bialata TaxID=797122 RepID=A0A9K3D6P9_9EUKA|nr:hypothetical protein KIPB_012484 [Kipferlia bialata]|eukprot:g12484.t1